ncbi:hypothetical protein PTT_16509 [Pyrenophora teres f. teres 0-1]|uniref:Uncharacterized protein n=1 Tax=Pyrenophora teres f. teres (strain 0-1) TaxID=861557 RepID=E3S2H8_PYRTT|nr:hypothetical protein PTT_16509 [Pyrenophora teres f. teres 0-1]
MLSQPLIRRNTDDRLRNDLRIERPEEDVQIDYLRKSARNATIRKHVYDAVKLDTSVETT